MNIWKNKIKYNFFFIILKMYFSSTMHSGKQSYVILNFLFQIQNGKKIIFDSLIKMLKQTHKDDFLEKTKAAR